MAAKADKTASSATPPASYEQARDELARVVATLESGGLGLEESLSLWERGEALARQCTAFLDGASERVDAALRAADRPDSVDDERDERTNNATPTRPNGT